MQITVLGASRPIGAYAVKKALSHGHSVIALARSSPETITVALGEPLTSAVGGSTGSGGVTTEGRGGSLQVIQGDATNVEDLRIATKGSDAVLVFLGGKGKLKTTVVSDCIKILVEILPVKTRLVTISNVGVGNSEAYQNWFVKVLIMKPSMEWILADKAMAEKALKESRITKWTALRAGWLVNRPENLENVQLFEEGGEGEETVKVTTKVGREDIAGVAVKIVESGYGDKYWGKAVSVVSG